MELDFTTTNVDVSVVSHQIPDHLDIIVGPAIVTWEAEIECREWGIKGLYPIIKEIEFTIMLENPETGEVDAESIIKLDNSEKLKTYMRDYDPGYCYIADFFPILVEFDWKAMEATVEF